MTRAPGLAFTPSSVSISSMGRDPEATNLHRNMWGEGARTCANFFFLLKPCNMICLSSTFSD